MAHHRYKRTPADKAAQKARTAKNKERKYLKLMEERPNDAHMKVWEAKATGKR